MSDLVSRLRVAIEETEQKAREDIDHFDDVAEPGDPRDRYILKLSRERLRRCAADRELLDLIRNELVDDPHDQTAGLMLGYLAAGYGISVEEETPG